MNTTLNMRERIKAVGDAHVNRHMSMRGQMRGVALAAAVLLTSTPAFATGGGDGGSAGLSAICFLAEYFKVIIGAIAVIAVLIWAMGYFFKKNDLYEIGLYIILGCVVAAGASTLIGKTGLTATC